MTHIAETAVHLRRAIPADRDEQLARMGDILAVRGYIVALEDIESAWSAACLASPYRPSWDSARFFDDDKLFSAIMAQLEPSPVPVDTLEVEVPDGEAAAEQDDDSPAEREAGGEAAGEQGEQAAAVPKRRGRPPKKRD